MERMVTGMLTFKFNEVGIFLFICKFMFGKTLHEEYSHDEYL